MVVNRFDVYLIELDPAVGSEIKKTRPCVIVSPNEMNCLKTVLIAPMTTKGFHAPSRVELQFQDKTGLVLLDQLRSVDKSRLVKKLGTIDAKAQKMISSTLVDMFEM
ncbi:MAG: type II toxin-antitoxin system PemK/MazF family toxin [Methylobacter sp.]|jgi:mRNA interferase MazF|uniref:type II toxin-antitoxin system PemK/MazF family toxin n=1 Tax=Methylobacter sp. TaxID=2051955 RepID=UPI002601173A|nr:type II toxin-antitoxin system PemK/MazF family toxin [Methylobacter sp.]MCK9619723.1 type II toxin-antitoxin system PemK/MazF family toxin [Methylobacter sp.]